MEKNKFKKGNKKNHEGELPPEYDGSHEEKWEKRRNRDWKKLVREELDDDGV